jgi:thiol:disulfide interchange protein DsbD
MRKITFCSSVFLLIFVSFSLFSQEIYAPVSWSFFKSEIKNGNVELSFKADIDEGWHLYSQHLPEGGPIPTSFSFEKDSLNFELIGEVREPDPIKEYDPNFEMELLFFGKEAVFTQKIKILSQDTFTIKGSLEFMVCNDKMCLPPEVVEYKFYIEKEVDSDSNIWSIFIAGFLGGLLALLTPCVFPMLPLTVSFFTKQSKTRSAGIKNAIIYAFSIIAIYVLLGMAVSIIFGADALNALSTNVWFNIFFFLLLVVFAISFLGAFEITLPSSWINKADDASNKGGLIGIFFMAFTLSLVSFSCTGPIIGTLLVQAAVSGSYLSPFMGMFGFALALSLPFGLFAAFPGWLNSLPKSGGWLNTVKVSLGFLELALALKFLSNADLVIQAGILTREIFLAIWIAVFAALSLYLLGMFKLSHDDNNNKISVSRAFFALLFASFTIYLMPGLWGAPLKLISGFPPPMFYSESPNGFGSSSATKINNNGNSGKIAGDPAHCPHNLNCFHDYEEGLAYAKESGKPVMLDFTGWACVNCRKMEEQVWSDPRVLERLQNDYVLISLYVDEKTLLPKAEQYTSVTTGKLIKSIGNKWSDFQISKFKTNSQPWYVLIDHQGNELNQPQGYDPDIDTYIGFLEKGKVEFEKSKKRQKATIRSTFYTCWPEG